MAGPTYVGDVLVDNAGNYIGDFSGGAGVDGQTPLGFAHGISSVYTADIDWSGVVNLSQAFVDYWGNPSDHAHQSIAPILFDLPTLRAQIVTDPSGPPGLEDKPACWLDGAGNEGLFTWIGETASQASGPYSPATSGWLPANGSIWCMSGWFRAVPDDTGFIAEGFQVEFGAARYAYGTGGAAFLGPFQLTLTQEWQQLSTRFMWVWSTTDAMPVISLSGTHWHHTSTKNVNVLGTHEDLVKEGSSVAPYGYGRVAIKELHLWTCQLLQAGYHAHAILPG